MICQGCKKNNATVHLTEITDGKRYESHLCEECAQKQGLAVKNQIPLNELLSTLLSVQAQTKDESPDDQPETGSACPACGMTLKKFAKTALLGCPGDYTVFEKQLASVIKNTQSGRTEHCGKIPSKTPRHEKNRIELLSLQKQLEQAVKNEDYETAAKLRDQIKKLQ